MRFRNWVLMMLTLLLTAVIVGCDGGSKEVRLDGLEQPDRSAMTPEQQEQARQVLESVGRMGVAPPGTPGAPPPVPTNPPAQ